LYKRLELGLIIGLLPVVSGLMGLPAQAAYYPGDTPAQFVAGPVPLQLPPYITLKPYNTGFQAPYLWRIEATRIWRSQAVLSPDGSQFFFTEVLYQPSTRQVSSTLFTVDLPVLEPPPPPPVASPSPTAKATLTLKRPKPVLVKPADPRLYTSWFDVNFAGHARRVVWRVGDERPETFAWQVLVPVDWSADGQHLLVKRQQGVMYTGLRTSDLVVLDQAGTRLTLYGELARAVNYYWKQHGAKPDLFRLSWDLQPLGWAVGSNEVFYFKAWAFSQHQKPTFLGLWAFDLATHQPKLLSENPDVQATVAANGYEVTLPDPVELKRLQAPLKPPVKPPLSQRVGRLKITLPGRKPASLS
jgi:hypothetical protein